ncbi:MAG: hypothetical protein II766_00145 [Paludibacteraceae bacterium]|nr:hypothetical protein [Paludibacteraceae bacterium]
MTGTMTGITEPTIIITAHRHLLTTIHTLIITIVVKPNIAVTDHFTFFRLRHIKRRSSNKE